MKKLSTSVALIAILALSACGGSGSDISPTSKPTVSTGGSGSTVGGSTGSSTGSTGSTGSSTGGTTATGPASTQVADLIAFASSGTATNLGGGLTRTTRTATQNGVTTVVSVDRLAGYGDGLVQYRQGNQVALYTVAGDLVGDMTVGSGIYNGPLTLSYKLASGDVFQVATGEMNIMLDMATGEASIGGIAGNTNNNIEFFGNASIANGAFTDNGAIVRLRDGAGNAIRDEVGTINGVLADGTSSDAVFGTVASTNGSGFVLNGGYTATNP